MPATSRQSGKPGIATGIALRYTATNLVAV
jgi:hypothetical protein